MFCSAHSGKRGGQSSLHADPVRMLKFTSQLRYVETHFIPGALYYRGQRGIDGLLEEIVY